MIQTRVLQKGLLAASTVRHGLCAFSTEEASTVDSAFHLLGVAQQFGISASELKENYHRMMTKYHPDKHTNKPQSERDVVEQKASRVTAAFQTLQHPHTRATHLLNLLGNPMEETSSTDLVGIDFLTKVMEVRESIDSSSPESMDPLWKDAQTSIGRLLQDLETAFDKEHDLDKAIELAAQLQYWQQIENSIKEKMQVQ